VRGVPAIHRSVSRSTLPAHIHAPIHANDSPEPSPMTLLLTLVGLVVGWLADESWGALVGAGLGCLAANGWTLGRQVRQLQFQVLQLQQQQHWPPQDRPLPSARAEATGAETAATRGNAMFPGDLPPSDLALPRAAFSPFEDAQPASTAPAYTLEGAGTASGSAASGADATSTRAAAAAPGPAAPSPFPQIPRTPPSPLAPVWRWLVGGNTIVKAGIAILFIGLAFLAKLASEQVTVSVEVRLMAVGLVALALMAVGWRLRARRPGYAQVLQGGAVAVLYLTLFVAMRWFGVIGAVPALVAMLLVAAFSAMLAVLQNARSLAVVGALGGFATPLLVATGGGNPVGLFSLYLLLDIGIALVAWHRTWRSLNLIGFVFTFGIAAAWGLDRYRAADYGPAQAFLVAYFLLFVAVLLMPGRRLGALRAKPDAAVRVDGAAAAADEPAPDRPFADRLDRWVDGSLLFGLPTVVFAMQYGLVRHSAYGVALSALVLAAFYIGLARWLQGRRSAVAFEGSLAIGVVFVSLVIPFALDASSTAGAWALEGAGLVWLGFRQRRLKSRAFGYALIALSGLALGIAYDHAGPIVSVFDGLSLGSLLLAAGALIAGLAVSRNAAPASLPARPPARGDDEVAPERPVFDAARLQSPRTRAFVEYALIGWAFAWLMGAVLVHVDHWVAPHRYWVAALLVAGSAVSIVFAELSRALAWRRVALPAALQAPLLGAGVLALGALGMAPVEFGGWWAWPLALATHLWLLRRVAAGWPSVVRHVVHTIGVLVLGALGAMEGSALTLDFGDDARGWSWLGWFVVPALLIGLIGRPRAVATWPVRDAPRAYRWTAAGLLSFAMLGFTLVANLFANGEARPLPYVPVLNPLDLGIAAVLVAVTLWLVQRTWRTVDDVGPTARASTDADALANGSAAPATTASRSAALWRALAAWAGLAAFGWLNGMLLRGFFHYGGVPYSVDAWFDSLAVQSGLTLLWTLTALAAMWLSARRGWRVGWITGAALLALVIVKLLTRDLSGSGTVARIVSFIGAGAVMLVIGYVAPLPSKARTSPSGVDDAADDGPGTSGDGTSGAPDAGPPSPTGSGRVPT
jgi:uncharacterized membrane protein